MEPSCVSCFERTDSIFSQHAIETVETAAMIPTRPTVVLVMAILTIIFGGLWAVTSLCSGVTMLLFHTINLPQLAQMREFSELLQREVPGYITVEVSSYVLGLVLSVLLIVAGIGLLRMKGWARWTALICGVTLIIAHSAHIAYHWIYVDPVRARWTQEKMPKLPPGAPNVTALFDRPIVKAIMVGGTLVFSIGFPIALVVVMLLPNVGAAFARTKGNLDDPTKQG
jgi:hypothetical protein